MEIDEFIERKICIAMISSSEFLQAIVPIWNPSLLISSEARMLSGWAKDYFDQYNSAPGQHIESIYISKISSMAKEQAEWIESTLESLSEESVDNPVDVQFIIDQTKEYFRQRSLRRLADDINFELDKGNSTTAEDLLSKYSPITTATTSFLDPFHKSMKTKIQEAFKEREVPLIKFSKALGKFWNQELIRGGFVALMGAEKKGKSMLLIELAMRAVKSGSKIAFFQAGDMTELQQLRRLAIYLTERSDEERYCRGQWIPQVDCLLHQTDECNNDSREGMAKIFKNKKDIEYQSLVKAATKNPDHIPCHNCKEMVGTPWLKWREGSQPLTWPSAYKSLVKFGLKHSEVFRISTHSNGTLSVKGIKGILSGWQKESGFVPDVIIIDYADLLISDIVRIDFRHQQNHIWQQLRNLSQETNSLVITVTQISARGYGKELLSMDDFAEDKRKFSHVTAMYGLNQTPDEKRIGMMRINELVVREGDFDSKNPVTILQRLQIGRPFLGSWR